MLQRLLVVGRHALRRDPGDGRDDRLDLLGGDRLLALVGRHQHLHRADLVDHVDRLVGQLAVVDVARRELDRRLDRVGRVLDLVMLLERRAEAGEDLDRILDRRLVDVDLLEAPEQGPVLLEMVAELLVGGRADAADRPARQGRLEQVRSVHRAARGRAGADHGVDLVDEQDRVGQLLELGHHRLQPLLEVAAIAGAGEQGAHVERVDHGFLEHLGHVALDDLARQALGDGGLADAGIADIERVVLRAAAQDLDGTVDLGAAADQRVDPAAQRLLVEVDGELLEGALILLLALFGLRFLGALDLLRLGRGLALADSVADVADRVEAAHVLLLQEIDGIALALGEEGDEHVGAGHLVAAG